MARSKTHHPGSKSHQPRKPKGRRHEEHDDDKCKPRSSKHHCKHDRKPEKKHCR